MNVLCMYVCTYVRMIVMSVHNTVAYRRLCVQTCMVGVSCNAVGYCSHQLIPISLL